MSKMVVVNMDGNNISDSMEFNTPEELFDYLRNSASSVSAENNKDKEKHLRIQLINGNCISYSSNNAHWEIYDNVIKVETRKENVFYVINNIIQFSEG